MIDKEKLSIIPQNIRDIWRYSEKNLFDFRNTMDEDDETSFVINQLEMLVSENVWNTLTKGIVQKNTGNLYKILTDVKTLWHWQKFNHFVADVDLISVSKIWMKVEYFLTQLKRETSVRIYIKIISVWYENQIEKLENGTRRAQIPGKPLDPPISWIVTQSMIFQIVEPFCVFASTQIYKRPFLWSSCVSVQ